MMSDDGEVVDERVRVGLCVAVLAIILTSYVITGADLDLGIVKSCARLLQHNIETQGEAVFRWLISPQWNIVHAEIPAITSLGHVRGVLLHHLVPCDTTVNVSCNYTRGNASFEYDETLSSNFNYRRSPVSVVFGALTSRVSRISNYSNHSVIAKLMHFSRSSVRAAKELWSDGEVLVTVVGSELAAVLAPVTDQFAGTSTAGLSHTKPTIVKVIHYTGSILDLLSSHLAVKAQLAYDSKRLLHWNLCHLLTKASVSQAWYASLSTYGAQKLSCARIVCLRVDVAALIDRKYKALVGLAVLALEGTALAVIGKAVNKWKCII